MAEQQAHNIEAGVLVRCRPGKYYYDRRTRTHHHGMRQRRRGSEEIDSGTFRISEAEFKADQQKEDFERMFQEAEEI